MLPEKQATKSKAVARAKYARSFPRFLSRSHRARTALRGVARRPPPPSSPRPLARAARRRVRGRRRAWRRVVADQRRAASAADRAAHTGPSRGTGGDMSAAQRCVSALWQWLRRLVYAVLRHGPLPQHVAFIMDGNRRFADRRRLGRERGHHFGYLKVRLPSFEAPIETYESHLHEPNWLSTVAFASRFLPFALAAPWRPCCPVFCKMRGRSCRWWMPLSGRLSWGSEPSVFTHSA